jgi:hypothetical protein
MISQIRFDLSIALGSMIHLVVLAGLLLYILRWARRQARASDVKLDTIITNTTPIVKKADE